jgi:hypothetical protein
MFIKSVKHACFNMIDGGIDDKAKVIILEIIWFVVYNQ